MAESDAVTAPAPEPGPSPSASTDATADNDREASSPQPQQSQSPRSKLGVSQVDVEPAAHGWLSATDPAAKASEGAAQSASASELTPNPSTEAPSKTPSRAPSPKASHEPSRATSHSSAASSSQKGSGAADAEPTPVYGTRSRKSGARVNYADDDYEFEMAVARADVPKPRSNNESSRAGQTIRLTSTAANGQASASSGADKVPSPPNSQAPERKKRKYERQTSKVAPQPEGRIPGTSHFSASPGAPDQPSSKKRKTGDGVSQAADSAAVTRQQAALPAAVSQARMSQVVTFVKTGANLKNGKLHADDGDIYGVDDTVYLICEPPGDPYYLCRIMEFRKDDPDDPNAPVTSMLVNWFYRPKDIGRYSADPRYLFGSMQSDESPITSLRGKCKITHKSEIANLDEYRKQPESFWFNQLYDRYIMRPYEIIPTSSVINVPERVKKALDEKWKYLVVEPARLKELTAAVKLCKRCQTYCAPSNSVDCGVCHNTYHMACVRPALTKKPSRGFAWSCGPCSRAQERRLEQRSNGTMPEEGEEEFPEDEEDDANKTTAPSPQDVDMTDTPANELDMAHADLWHWRYLGIHCKVEDVLQYDDRAIYPRASSRLGPRHQANVILWPGRPVELVRPAEIRKKYGKTATAKAPAKAAKDTQATTDPEQAKAVRPKWVQDAPHGYVPRGEDFENGDKSCTATRLFVLPEGDESAAASSEALVDEYMAEVDRLADIYGQVKPFEKVVNHERISIRQVSSNYLDRALKLLQKHNFDKTAALAELKAKHSPKDLGNPDLNKEELKRFEDGIIKYGTDFRMVRKTVKSKSNGDIIRFYYTWKSTKRGKEVRDRHEGRRGAKKGRAEASWTEIADEEDDSAFDAGKADKHKRQFQCKFCSTLHSRQWRRAPNVSPGLVTLLDPKGSNKDKANQLVVALCNRCAIMWRKYGMRYEDPEEVAKSIAQTGGRAWKRKTDEELLREIIHANEAARVATPPLASQAAAAMGIAVTIPWEAPKKKSKAGDGKEGTPVSGTVKKQAPAPPPRPPTPPIIPQEAKMRDLPCFVCRHGGLGDDEKIFCKDCRLTVHRRCYAVPEDANSETWVCDTCANDRNPQVSLEYVCCLCNTSEPPIELIEQPKNSHKKKTERDKEKENMERDLRLKLLDAYVKDQRVKGKPTRPRDALKKTASNNWMHITCAVFTPEIRFADAMAMDGIEGLAAVAANPARADNSCKICNMKRSGFCVACHHCHKPFHVSCAQEEEYQMGFDVTPVKGSRKDTIQTVTFQAETGLLAAAIWCKDHQPKTIIHDMTEVTEDGIIALQAFVRKYKAADLTLTGTARKANLLGQSTKILSQPARRSSLVVSNGTTPSNAPETNGHDEHSPEHKCVSCGTDSTVKWHRQQQSHAPGQTNGFVPGTDEYRCHKCHIRSTNGEEAVPVVADEQDLAGPVPQPDYFGQIAMAARPRMAPEAPWPPPGHAPGPPGHAAMHVSPESWVRGLFETKITLINPLKGGEHIFEGRDFNIQLDGDPTPGFQYLQHWASTDCQYDAARCLIVTDDNQMIDSPGRFTGALASLLMRRPGLKSVMWRVVENRELHYQAQAASQYPPQLGPMHPSQPLPPVVYTHLPPVAPTMRGVPPFQPPPRTPPKNFFNPASHKYSQGPPGAQGPPPGPGMMHYPPLPPPMPTGPLPAYARATSVPDSSSSHQPKGPSGTARPPSHTPSNHQSPQRSSVAPVERGGPQPQAHSQQPQHHPTPPVPPTIGAPANFAGSPAAAAAAARASTPREVPAASGASSSPNLRNLMH